MAEIVPRVDSLSQLCQELHRVFDSDRVDVDYVYELMRNYKSDPKEWKKFAKFDRYRYTRNLVDAGNGKFNLMVLCWGEAHGSSIHDHANSHCFMKMLMGSLTETRFDYPGGDTVGELHKISITELKTNEVVYINDEQGLHRVENASHTQPAVSLHLYCPPFDACHAFDQRTGHKTMNKVTFWSAFGKRTPFQQLERETRKMGVPLTDHPASISMEIAEPENN
ncbi:unnamed protein product [Darwinula stevensoni]|uniref:Cysteine dioxygenase n=1 Tax=Darwinula stevensoni TaxID=69355 RepID=A0A7R9AAM7_9CRUS|nr:unnamed protein product [Darwinula stevensoni]CAG0898522.1 unnamed protein product [Darwinula stevensoni]